MLETPGLFNEAEPARRYPAENLAGFRWHTGATLRPLTPEEACPILFRDLGPVALDVVLARLLKGRHQRHANALAGGNRRHAHQARLVVDDEVGFQRSLFAIAGVSSATLRARVPMNGAGSIAHRVGGVREDRAGCRARRDATS